MTALFSCFLPHRWRHSCRFARSLAFALLIPGSMTGVAHAADQDIGQLMQRLSQQKSGRATFVERKYMAVLDRPLESSGELSYTAPARLEKRTLKPNQETLILDGDRISMVRGKQKIEVWLSQYPEAGALVESIRATLAGDRPALEQHYRLSLGGTAARWKLSLLPNDSRIAALVLRIIISGQQEQVRSIEYLQADGDRVVMQIDSTDTARDGNRMP